MTESTQSDMPTTQSILKSTEHSGTTQSVPKLFWYKKLSYLPFCHFHRTKLRTCLSALDGCVLTGLIVRNDMTVAAELEKIPFRSKCASTYYLQNVNKTNWCFFSWKWGVDESENRWCCWPGAKSVTLYKSYDFTKQLSHITKLSCHQIYYSIWP